MDTDDDILIQQPATADAKAGGPLVMLFHGLGSDPQDLRPLGAHLASAMPGAWVVSVRAPEPFSGGGGGWQWFPVDGVTETNRPVRVAAAMPAFTGAISRWQSRTGADRGCTMLVGFSQGAIMALESTQLAMPPAGRVAAIAGRFAQAPHARPRDVAIHLLHGEADEVISAGLALQAAAALQELGAAFTLDVFSGLGHGIDHRLMKRLQAHLGEGL